MNFFYKKSLRFHNFDWKEKLILLLVSSLFASTIYLLLPFSKNKYKIIKTNESIGTSMYATMASDLDGDGISEFMVFKVNNGIPAISFEKFDKEIIDQLNLKGKWVEKSEPVTSDLDKDGFKEIVAFTYYNDSIWINIIEAL
ncbi:MAG: hypothetical protein ACP5E3_05375 [Bacteroidales bacterium]